jgi:hypothetical protein
MIHSENSSAIASGRRPPATAASSSNVSFENIENLHARPLPPLASAPSMIHCSRRWCEDVLQRWSCMLSAPLTPQPRSACPFAHRHGRSNHLHVSVEPHVPHSHDHMVARMWHVSLALSLSNCRLIRRAQPRLTSATFVCVILAGTSICRTIHRSISMLLDGICR